MVLGILMFFYRKSLVLGVFFSVISVIIILLFYKTQDAIALLWKETREEETEVLGEFSQDVMARQDILGMNKGNFVIDLFNIKFKKYAGKHIRASFLGNIPSTLFFSLLNVGEGVVLIIGIIMMMQDKMTIGEVYILLSYVGLLNMPFYSLKYEFAQMPKVLAAIERINDVYSENSEVECNEKLLCWESEGTIEFDGVTFGYNSENLVLNDVNFQINNGENVIIEGRTGSGKSTILQLIAGFYKPDKGQVKIGGYDVRSYNEENYYSRLCYIMQFNVIIEDTIRNNVTRFNENFSDEEIYQALKTVNLFEWIRKECDNGLDTIINARSISQDRALLLVWAGVLLANPKVLLVDECDSNIQDNTIKIIDDIINSQLDKTTIVIVTHKRRNSIKVHKEIKIETGRIINVIDSNFALE